MPGITALHVQLEGFTAFFKHPLTITGTQISLPCPPYSTLLGMLSAVAGRVVSHTETRIGFEFHCASQDVEIEKTNRLALNKGMLSPHREGQGVLKRYVHFMPKLDLYLTNLEFERAFLFPACTPSLGRSQDIAWVTKVETVELTAVPAVRIGPTLIPEIKNNIPSLLVRCPEWFENNIEGRTRTTGPFGFYQGLLPTAKDRFLVTMKNLYHPSDFADPQDGIYLHDWLA